MKLTLGIQDLLILRSMLLEMGGGYAELLLAKKLADEVFSEQELKDYKVAVTELGVVWNMSGENKKPLPTSKELDLGPEATNMIASTLRKMDEAKALKQYHRGLYEAFVIQPKLEEASDNKR